MYRCIEGSRYRHIGASDIGTSVHRYIGTSVHRYIGTSVHRYIGTSVHRRSAITGVGALSYPILTKRNHPPFSPQESSHFPRVKKEGVPQVDVSLDSHHGQTGTRQPRATRVAGSKPQSGYGNPGGGPPVKPKFNR